MTTFLIIIVAIAIILALIPNIKKHFQSPDESQYNIDDEFEVNLNFDPSQNGDGHYLVIDVETTGLPKRRNALPSESNNWPRVVQIAWILLDKDGGMIEEYESIIKQTDPIPADAVRIHGISTRQANSEGIEPEEVFSQLVKSSQKAKYLVAHNVEFDKPIIESELIRHGLNNVLEDMPAICTMMQSTAYCSKRIGTGGKWPKLSELYKACYMPDYPYPLKIIGGHNALVDVYVAGRCLIKLKEVGVIRV
jgi:DNA polymerase III epsilon subunit-like protein